MCSTDAAIQAYMHGTHLTAEMASLALIVSSSSSSGLQIHCTNNILSQYVAEEILLVVWLGCGVLFV